MIAGKDGKFEFGAAAVAYLDNWDLTINSGTAEGGGLGQDWTEHVGTVKDFSGSASGSLDKSDPGQLAMITQMTSGDAVPTEATFTVSTDMSFTGQVLLTSVQIGAERTGKVSFSCNFQGTGELTPTLPV